MSAPIRPWGDIGWLLPRLGTTQWHLIAASSFEDRCVAVTEWILASGFSIRSASLLRIANPPSANWATARPRVDANFAVLQKHLAGGRLQVIPTDLLPAPIVPVGQIFAGGEVGESVVLDISATPKKFFLYALLRLLVTPSVKNLVATYTRAATYPEVPLCEDALPPSPLQGYSRIDAPRGAPRMIVGVGYTALSVEELLDRAKYRKLDFVFPFPPASPAFRRNWTLLSRLMPEGFPASTEVHRINGMDAFETYERVASWGIESDLDILPLGPKPHALGMAMACMKSDGRHELIYSQPRSYHPQYSEGIARRPDGRPEILAYCLKRNGVLTF